MVLRKLGYDVSLFRSRGGANENQVAVDIAVSPHVDLCLAVPNGNRLAMQDQSSVPRWLQPTCGHIAGALQSVATKASLFVGDAILSPGVKHVNVYKVLVPMFQESLVYHNIPLVSNAVGIELDKDGVHWTINSLPAVLDIINRMALGATDTNTFNHLMHLPLWHWRLNGPFERHYPCCIICNKDASNAHLGSKQHREQANGALLGFDFPDRDFYVSKGFQFFTGQDSAAVVDTSPTLPADHPMWGEPTRVHSSFCLCTSFTLRQQDSKWMSPKSSISHQCQVSIVMAAGHETHNMEFTFLANGQARDGYGANDRPLAFKSQAIGDGIENRNRMEWEIYKNTPKLRQFLPKVYGYFEQNVANKTVSFLLVDKVRYTFAELLIRVIEHSPSAVSINLMLLCSERVLDTLVLAAKSGIQCHDWHTGNIGFIDKDCMCMKLIDWERNGMAIASLSYSHRIDKALIRFLHYLPGPHTYSKVWRQLIPTKSTTAQTNIAHWSTILTEMSVTLQSWWNSWKDKAKMNQLPSSDEMKSVFQRCKSLAFDRLSTFSSQPSPSGSSSSSANIANTEDSLSRQFPGSEIYSPGGETYFPTIDSNASILTRIPTVSRRISIPTLPRVPNDVTVQIANAGYGLDSIPELSQLQRINDSRVQCHVCRQHTNCPKRLEDSKLYKGPQCPLVSCGSLACFQKLHSMWLDLREDFSDTKRVRSSEMQEHTEADDQPDTSAYVILDPVDHRHGPDMRSDFRDTKRLRSSEIHEHTVADDQPDTSEYVILDPVDHRQSPWTLLEPADEYGNGLVRHSDYGECSLVDPVDENDTGQERDWEYGDCADDVAADHMAEIIQHVGHQMDSFQKDSDELPSTVEPRRPEGVPEDGLGDNGNAIIDVYERAIKSAPPRLFGIRHH